MSPGAEKVYDAIVTRLIAVFYPACVKDVTLVDGQSNEVPFRARGVRVIEPGWTALYPRRSEDKNEDEQELPEFRPGERGPHEPFAPGRGDDASETLHREHAARRDGDGGQAGG